MAEEKKKKKKSDTRVDSGEAVDEIVSEHSSMKKEKEKKKKREIKDGFAGEDGEIGGRESEKLGEDFVVKKKKSKEQRIESESENDGKKEKNKVKMADSELEDGVKKKSKKERIDSEAESDGKKEKNKVKMADSELEDGVKKKSKKKHKETKVDSEAEDDGKKRKKESESDVIRNSESSKFVEKPIVETDDAIKKKGKRKRDDCDLGAQENTDKEMKRKSKKKKESVDFEVEETSLNSAKDAKKKSKKKKKKHIVDSEVEVEDINLNSTKDAKKKSKEEKQSEDSEAEENALNSMKDSKKKRKKKKKQSETSEAEENNNDGKDAKRKRKKQESGESDKDVATPSSKSTKKVKFSDQLKTFFPIEDEEEEVKLVRGTRFTKEEDAIVKKAVLDYIENHALGDKGIEMVMKCKSYPQLKGCWKEIASALPERPRESVYNRAHSIFEAGSKGVWTKEDYELLFELHKKHGNDWRTISEAMGKERKHVKDAWRRSRLALKNKGSWTREEYQNLFDLVNKDIRTKVFHEKHSKHGMLKDNIPWMAVSDELKTRDHVTCCHKWYEQLTSPMVAKGIWANVDDYRLVDELLKLDAACIDDVDWDYLLENRDGDACRRRWNQMVLHIGLPGSKTFAEQVEILSERYRPELAEDREDFDNRPYDPED